MKDLLLEIGCENLPPASIRPAFEQLGSDVRAKLDEHRLTYEGVYVTGTPRRLVLVVRGLATSQTSTTETVTGPPVSKGFDENGEPTKTALGFAKSHGVPVAKLERIETERGLYLGFTRKLKSERAAIILKRFLPDLITGLRFPKVMRWERSGVRFARPIRWLVCLFGGSVLRFEIAGVKSGDVTYVIPWLRREKYKIKNADHYMTVVKKAGLLIDHVERRRVIESLARRTAERSGLILIADPGLIDELTFMLESPRVMMGDFDNAYLKLPPEVLVTAMKAHQRYIALREKGKKLVPKFITFTEGRVGSPAVVRRGNEKVLKARLEDAHFYWEEDLKTGVEGLAKRLDSIVFIEGMGTLKDKGERLVKLGLLINSMEPESGRLSTGQIERAAFVAKADLASEMVKDGKEFTLLEGLIGSHYAGRAGENSEVVAAVREQYLPRTPSDPLPKTPLGSLLSIADRIDTISGCFMAGHVPTGSQDPYALRRQASGLIRLLEHRAAVSIRPLLEAAVAAYTESGLGQDARPAEVSRQLEEFFRLRTETFLKEKGIAYDVVAAVGAVAWSTPATALARARAMQNSRGDKAFELLITGAKRVGNILPPEAKVLGAEWGALEEAFLGSGQLSATGRFDPGRFEDDAEHNLHRAVQRVIPDMIRYEASSDVTAVFGILSGLGPRIDEYFDRVLVNCPDESLRANRQQFLASVFALFSRYADFSFIVEEEKTLVQ
ncbi:MAG: glycine--tRNA ligase subunit beta [Candidatus Latescibacterota bacterium]|nr:MAG: glycine--tRNA ligase subunit beta [Candidatus Latescibacterota bacterium]